MTKEQKRKQSRYECGVISQRIDDWENHMFLNHDYYGKIASGEKVIDFYSTHPLAQEIREEHKQKIGNKDIKLTTKITTTHSKFKGAYEILEEKTSCVD